uniref:Uncharacterized protein n=1 Tax=Acrobeloides nanus TaxID=290746 RepID=A0A914D8D8_9BILA
MKMTQNEPKRKNANGTPVKPTENKRQMLERIRTTLSQQETALNGLQTAEINPNLMTQLLNLMVEQQKLMRTMFELLSSTKTEESDESETDADLKEKKRSLVISGLQESTKPTRMERHADDFTKSTKSSTIWELKLPPLPSIVCHPIARKLETSRA